MPTAATPSSSAPLAPLDLETVQAALSRHIAVYRYRKPVYQMELLNSFRRVWRGPHARVLDVGGGTGIIGQAIKDMFAATHVVSVDVEDRFMPTLDIETRTYDGVTLPFGNASFDCAVISNVMHHVPIPVREPLMREIHRVVAGPVYIKDHLARSRIDHGRLVVLDAIGNIAFGGMVSASYLGETDWTALAATAGYRIDASVSGAYRSGAMQVLFPNRLETTMRLERL